MFFQDGKTLNLEFINSKKGTRDLVVGFGRVVLDSDKTTFKFSKNARRILMERVNELGRDGIEAAFEVAKIWDADQKLKTKLIKKFKNSHRQNGLSNEVFAQKIQEYVKAESVKRWTDAFFKKVDELD